MIRAYGAAMALGGLLVKVAVGFVGFIVLVGSMVPPSTSDARPGAEPGGPGRPADTVVLSVPDGKPAGNLTIVDASGRELARLTHWANGHTAVVTRGGVGPTVGCYHNAGGSVDLLVTGTAGETQIHVQPDGSTRAFMSEPSRFVNPPTPMGVGTAKAPETRRPRTVGSGGMDDES